MVGLKNLGDRSLNRILNALSIGLHTFSLEWPVFGLSVSLQLCQKVSHQLSRVEYVIFPFLK